MTEHEDRGAHEAKADALERELDDMKERSDGLGGDIEDAGEDWERKKSDESVPGAGGRPVNEGGEDDAGGDVDADELDFGKDIDTDAVVAEDGPPADDDEDDDEANKDDDSDADESDESDDDESDED